MMIEKILTKSRSMRRVRRGSIVLCIIYYFNNYYNLEPAVGCSSNNATMNIIVRMGIIILLSCNVIYYNTVKHKR